MFNSLVDRQMTVSACQHANFGGRTVWFSFNGMEPGQAKKAYRCVSLIESYLPARLIIPNVVEPPFLGSGPPLAVAADLDLVPIEHTASAAAAWQI